MVIKRDIENIGSGDRHWASLLVLTHEFGLLQFQAPGAQAPCYSSVDGKPPSHQAIKGNEKGR